MWYVKKFFDLPAALFAFTAIQFFQPAGVVIVWTSQNAGDLAVCLTSLRYAQAGGFGLQYGV